MLFQSNEDFRKAYVEECRRRYGADPKKVGRTEQYLSLAGLIGQEIRVRWAKSRERMENQKQVYYFSSEFLIGHLLNHYLKSLEIEDEVSEGLKALDIELSELQTVEQDAALGNGGLGRLAACFLDSLAYLGIAGHGNGIRYRYGLFKQSIVRDEQVETAENWMNIEYPWDVRHPDECVDVRFGGEIESTYENGQMEFEHVHFYSIRAVPYEIPIMSTGGADAVNTLKLWQAESTDGFDLHAFNQGNYQQAYESMVEAAKITAVLYPNDSHPEGKKLRLMQQYLFVSAGIHDIIRGYKKKHGSIDGMQHAIAVHINDTHPALCIPEMIRILIDDEGLSWDKAWEMTFDIMSYTNHTVLPEALETWPVSMLKELLPRVYMIIEEINRRFLETLLRQHYQGIERVSIIRGDVVHMAALAVVGSHSVNGVAELHTKILKEQVMKEYDSIFPDRFNNKTNGISHRIFFREANPELSQLITETIGPAWLERFDEIEGLSDHVNDAAFLEQFAKVKRIKKMQLAEHIQRQCGININPDSIFDVHVKRIHAYKRQLLNVLSIMCLYNRIIDGERDIVPHTFIFSGKAASGYVYAKNIIKLINRLARRINEDALTNEFIKVVFIPDFNVSQAQIIYPGADISQQISTAGLEASGTGNMKFMMNGAVTLGTMDGANIEIFELVGQENMIQFGMTVQDIQKLQQSGYNPWNDYSENAEIRRVIRQLKGQFFPGDTHQFDDISYSLLEGGDTFYVLKDLADYQRARQRAMSEYTNTARWRKMQVFNIAKSAKFSSDNTILQYAHEIWEAMPR